MSLYLIVGAVIVSAIGSLVFSTLTYSLREVSRVRLGEHLERRGWQRLLEPTMHHLPDLVFVTAVGRMVCNTSILLSVLLFCDEVMPFGARRYVTTAIIAVVITMFSSIAIPNALTRHAGDAVVAASVRPLQILRLVLSPLTKLMHFIDRVIGRSVADGERSEPQKMEHEIQQEILSVVEEGEKEGVVDEEEREMIESVIEFRDTTAGQIMTPRPEIVALELNSTLPHVKETLEESGHSRLPVFDGTLDHIVGILYARDLLKHLGLPASQFNIRSAMRAPFYVPETKPLRDLLHDFRLQKVHIAIVLDEYGGTAGLITIEDILEELVGDISDEHEPVEPAMFKRLDDQSAEVDARIYIDELNRLMGLSLPEDAGYDTLSGYVSTSLGRIPEAGAIFEQNGVKFTVLDAEPQKVNRVKIEVLPHSMAEVEAEAVR
jgi:CBS domain containing-hemolysin-like protein